jgi:hypothetical protein
MVWKTVAMDERGFDALGGLPRVSRPTGEMTESFLGRARNEYDKLCGMCTKDNQITADHASAEGL